MEQFNDSGSYAREVRKERNRGACRLKADRLIAAYRRLRNQAVWRLLAADNGPIVLGLLQAHLYEGERSLPASLFHERIHRDLEYLRSQGLDLPQSAQTYVADWLASGFIERRFPANAAEEEYELSSAAVTAVRFAASMVDRHASATESRLANVIQQLLRLAEDSDTNPETRVAKLRADRERIESEIESVLHGRLEALEPARALERTREIIALADDLIGDFRRVRDDFEKLNREFERTFSITMAVAGKFWIHCSLASI